MGSYFKVYTESDSVEFSKPGELVNVEGLDQSDYDEISSEQFMKKYASILKRLQ
jgi:hypothetical protein